MKGDDDHPAVDVRYLGAGFIHGYMVIDQKPGSISDCVSNNLSRATQKARLATLRRRAVPRTAGNGRIQQLALYCSITRAGLNRQ